MTALESLKERLLAESAALDAQVATCEHDLHKSPIGCPYCKRDTRQRDLLREAAEAIVVSTPADSDLMLLRMFSEGIDVARSYGDNAFHLYGAQLQRQYERALKRAADPDHPVRPQNTSPSPAPDGDGRR